MLLAQLRPTTIYVLAPYARVAFHRRARSLAPFIGKAGTVNISHLPMTEANKPHRDGDLVSAAAALAPMLRSRTVETDALSRLLPETIADFERARLFDMSVPKRYGGLQSSLETQLDVIIEIGRGDGAAA